MRSLAGRLLLAQRALSRGVSWQTWMRQMALSSKQPSQSHWYSRHPTTRLQHQLGGLPPPPAAGLSSSCNRAREDRSHSRRHRCGAALVTRCFLATSAANRAVMPCCNRTVSGRREKSPRGICSQCSLHWEHPSIHRWKSEEERPGMRWRREPMAPKAAAT